jgi:D-alanyl-D-alanine carboxypeptidase
MNKVLTIVFSLVFGFGMAQKSLSHQIDSVLTLKYPRTFSGVVLVSQGGKSIYNKAVGLAKTQKSKKIKMKSKFVLLSNSKQITAVLILREYDKGTLKLDEKISTYLPELPQNWVDNVTIRQLLNHTSGISGLSNPLSFKPGSGFKYGDGNYIILGKIIEKVSGKTYPPHQVHISRIRN